jgi:hypothetical protein
MTRILADISVSVDGFVTGPDPGPDNGLGTGGQALHNWAFSDETDDRRVLREATGYGAGKARRSSVRDEVIARRARARS